MAGMHSSFGIARWDGLAQSPDIPAIVSLEASVPNPFHRSATFAYRLERVGNVRTAVVDLGGREIVVLEETRRTPGAHSIEWDGHDAQGQEVHPGVYFVRARIEGAPDRIWRVVRLR